MRLFDLVFILAFLAAVGALFGAASASLRGRHSVARSILRRLGWSAAAYMLIVVLVSLTTPRRMVAIGEPQCSDDWCIAVLGGRLMSDSSGARYDVTFVVSSRARRAVQRERNVVAWLRDDRGRRYDAEPRGDEPPFDVQLGPGDSVVTKRVFRIPQGLSGAGIVIAREGGVPGPGCCIIGDEGSLFHRKSVVRLDDRAGGGGG